MVKFPDKREWQCVFNPDNKGGLVWHKDGSKTNKGTGAGGCRWCSRREHTFSLGLHTTLFQAELHIIKACVMENTEKGYEGTSIFYSTVRQPSSPWTASR